MSGYFRVSRKHGFLNSILHKLICCFLLLTKDSLKDFLKLVSSLWQLCYGLTSLVFS